MKWRKTGLVFAPDGGNWWARRYALLPTVEVLDESTLRVYFAALDDQRYGRIGYVELDARDPSKRLKESAEPALDLGALGQFDDSGVNPSCVVRIGDERRMYYIGWQRTVRVPYMLFAGLAIESGDGELRRVARTPILDRTDAEPYSRSAPFVMIDGGTWRMWYWSCLGWSEDGGVIHYNNVIRHLTSSDGLNWSGAGRLCLEPSSPDEYSLGRPWVIRDGRVYRMWYAIRSFSRGYRIGYAESSDGIEWIRLDDRVGIAPSETGWDSEMVCYPCVVDVAGRRYLFYNGDRYGATGFGYAVLEP